MKFIIKKSINGQFYFVLTAKNGETIAVSEMYKTQQGCKKGIQAVKRVALFATIVPFNVASD